MSIEALWTVSFTSNLGMSGVGVVAFEAGRLFGGDPDYIYLGKYDIAPDRQKLTCEVDVQNYSGRLSSIFGGLANFKLMIEGTVPKSNAVGSMIQANGHLDGNQVFQVALILTKRALLP
jgi:T3SS negative regulator,GrlR